MFGEKPERTADKLLRLASGAKRRREGTFPVLPGAVADPAGEEQPDTDRLSSDRDGDKSFGRQLVDVARQQGDPLCEVALLAGIEHAEEFGDRFAVGGGLKRRVGPDGGGGHGIWLSNVRPRRRYVARRRE